ncbi:MAG: hypothetical protein KF868_14030 [Acidobacteria bacterium]|nr:hypothetical protein [Acidobacteriota bacterium]
MEQKRVGQKRQVSWGRSRWLWYALLLVVIPVLIPAVGLYLREQGWTGINLTVIGMLFAGYWFAVIAVAARSLQARQRAIPARLASPLIELQLEVDLQERLAAFAASRRQRPAVAAFELLDREIPRFEQEEERERARRDNEHLRQQAGQGAFLVAVTTEILKRLLLLSGAGESDRTAWRAQVNDIAVRIVRDALDHSPAAS